MQENLNDLRTFLLVAQTGSFTKVAAQLNLSRAAVSHTISQLERRLGLKLFNRTTRSVATTDAGQQLYQQLCPLFQDIDSRLLNILNNQNQQRGVLRINGTIHAISVVLWQKFRRFLEHYPNITLELAAEMKFIDIVAERYDAGIREGGLMDKDMIAVRVSEAVRMCYVATPEYLSRHGTPQTPEALLKHNCIRLRIPTYNNLLPWEFEHSKTGERFKLAMQGNLIVNQPPMTRQAALDNIGISWEMADEVEADIQSGRLCRILSDWECIYPGYYLYFPNRTEYSPLLKTLVEWLRI
ncbi:MULTISPECIES: LysR family transcriptional regulator [Pasteurellaceae]|uniref:LysR family transcriptional regulator n=1 Tax=Rodentibacter genomosp. 2 TaxID=1908266 RepID=A0A1V3JQ56_9PAST|nr:LysR family transcriptional regulator [Rodentibacter genomosp. 2]MBF0752085.1 LysR family transcriptional regulator [Pasteurella sp. 19428wF3_WM03]OOF58392.1 LysR family transcriptional regulator [Rodentibacter genomosp. 2]TFU50613.1 LysR family transcriptional regulator [Pasteurella sp. WM03]